MPCDLWSTDKLATLVQVFARPGIDGAFGRVAFLDAPPGEARTTSARPGAELRIPMLLGENPVCTLSNISLRRSVMLASGGFDTDMAHNDDLEWLIRLVGRGARIVGLDQLQVWHRDGDGLPADLEGMAAGAPGRWPAPRCSAPAPIPPPRPHTSASWPAAPCTRARAGRCRCGWRCAAWPTAQGGSCSRCAGAA